MDVDKPRPDFENDLTAVERRLAAWRPACGSLSRDHMLFHAGRAAEQAESRSRFWQFATAASVVVIVTLGGVLAHERSQRIALESQTAVPAWPREPRSSTPPSVRLARIEPAGPGSYLALTTQLTRGVGDLSLPDIDLEPRPLRPPPAPSTSSSLSEPLRPIDLERVLDL